MDDFITFKVAKKTDIDLEINEDIVDAIVKPISK